MTNGTSPGELFPESERDTTERRRFTLGILGKKSVARARSSGRLRAPVFSMRLSAHHPTQLPPAQAYLSSPAAAKCAGLMARGLCACLLALAALMRAEPADTASSPSPGGVPFLQVFNSEDYAGSPINRHVLVAPNGLVYVANNRKILEFDGARWRQIPQPALAQTSALLADREGRIWTSVRGSLSQLMPDALGRLQFESRENRLPPPKAPVGELLGGLAADEGLYFWSANRLYLLRHDGSAATWEATHRLESLFQMEGGLFVTQTDSGLARVSGDALRPIATGGGPVPRVFAARRTTDSGGQLWLTSRGPMTWSGAGSAPEPLNAETDRWFQNNPALHAIFLEDGRLAFGTAKKGLLLFGPGGDLQLQLTKLDGLPGDRVNEIAEDAHGGLWLAQQAGLARVQLDSPYRRHRGIEDSVRDVARWGGRFYVAHGEGVAVLDPAARAFRELPGLPADTPGAQTFLPDAGRLLINAGGVREVTSDDHLEPVAEQALFALHRASAPGGGFIGLQRNAAGRALWLLAPEGARLRALGSVAHISEPERSGFDSGDGFFWGTDRRNRVWRADFRGGLRVDAPVESFALEPAPPIAGDKYPTMVFPFAGGPEAAREGRLFRYDPAARRFLPEDRIDGLPEGLGFNAAADGGDGTHWFSYGGPGDAARERPATPDHAPRLRLFHVTPAGADRWQAREFPAAAIGQLQVNILRADPATHTLWIGSTVGLFSADTTWRPHRPRAPLRVSVRQLATAAGEVLFAGDDRRLGAVRNLRPEERAVHVEFAAPVPGVDFRGHLHTQYRTRLDGLESEWTPWSPQTFRDFTNLPPGRFVFFVQARDPDDRESPEAMIALTVQAPWWLTPMAWLLYGALGLAGLTTAVNLRTQALRRKKAQLEQLVATRTAELSQQNRELTRLHRLELDEKISARLAEEKSRLEVLRYQLNPHFLFNALTSIRGQIPASLTAARATVDHLVDFCHLTLHDRQADELCTVSEELAMLRSFLDIERQRLGDFLQVEFEVAAAIESERIPRLLLLPLVENALKYGQVTSPQGLRLRIAARRDDRGLSFEVANTGEWVARPAAHGLASFGIGHENIRERLRRHYPAAHAFTHEATDGWVRVTLQLSGSDPSGR